MHHHHNTAHQTMSLTPGERVKEHLTDPHFLEHVLVAAVGAVLFLCKASETLVVLIPSFLSIGIGLISLSVIIYNRYWKKLARSEENTASPSELLHNELVHKIWDTGIFPEIITGMTMFVLYLLHIKLGVIVGVGFLTIIVTAIIAKIFEIYTDPTIPRKTKAKMLQKKMVGKKVIEIGIHRDNNNKCATSLKSVVCEAEKAVRQEESEIISNHIDTNYDSLSNNSAHSEITIEDEPTIKKKESGKSSTLTDNIAAETTVKLLREQHANGWYDKVKKILSNRRHTRSASLCDVYSVMKHGSTSTNLRISNHLRRVV